MAPRNFYITGLNESANNSNEDNDAVDDELDEDFDGDKCSKFLPFSFPLLPFCHSSRKERSSSVLKAHKNRSREKKKEVYLPCMKRKSFLSSSANYFSIHCMFVVG